MTHIKYLMAIVFCFLLMTSFVSAPLQNSNAIIASATNSRDCSSPIKTWSFPVKAGIRSYSASRAYKRVAFIDNNNHLVILDFDGNVISNSPVFYLLEDILFNSNTDGIICCGGYGVVSCYDFDGSIRWMQFVDMWIYGIYLDSSNDELTLVGFTTEPRICETVKINSDGNQVTGRTTLPLDSVNGIREINGLRIIGSSNGNSIAINECNDILWSFNLAEYDSFSSRIDENPKRREDVFLKYEDVSYVSYPPLAVGNSIGIMTNWGDLLLLDNTGSPLVFFEGEFDPYGPINSLMGDLCLFTDRCGNVWTVHSSGAKMNVMTAKEKRFRSLAYDNHNSTIYALSRDDICYFSNQEEIRGQFSLEADSISILDKKSMLAVFMNSGLSVIHLPIIDGS